MCNPHDCPIVYLPVCLHSSLHSKRMASNLHRCINPWVLSKVKHSHPPYASHHAILDPKWSKLQPTKTHFQFSHEPADKQTFYIYLDKSKT